MRTYFFVLVLMIIGLDASAKCGPATFNIWPASQELRDKNLIIVNYGMGAMRLEGFQITDSDIFQVRGERGYYTSKTSLVHQGAGLWQFRIEILDTPRAGEKLALETSKLWLGKADGNEVRCFSQSERKYIQKEYIYQPEAIAYDWSDLNISFSNNEYQRLGCGPSINTYFSLSNAHSDVIVAVQLTDPAGDTKFFYAMPWYGKLAIGRGMCGGLINLESQAMYQIEFQALIDGGNSAEKITSAFESPGFKFR